jgi:site-specific DNA recombinase
LSGLEDQKNAISRYATQKGLTVAASYMDVGVSGVALNRPQLLKLMADCRAGKVGMVLTQDPDRLSRDYSQLLELSHMFQAEGVRLVFATREGRNQYAMFGEMVRALAELSDRMSKGEES